MSIAQEPTWMSAIVDEHVATGKEIHTLIPDIIAVAELMEETFARGGLAYTFGNGGSAADAQHFSGELIGHYKRDRHPFPCLTLGTDAAVMTCTANDYCYEDVFSRQVKALARPGSIFIAFTTSGRSQNIVDALKAAKTAGGTTVMFGGSGGGPALQFCDYALVVPSSKTARIQEVHTTMMHMISEYLDAHAAGEEPQA